MASGIKYKTLKPNQLAFLLDNAAKSGREAAFATMKAETHRIKDISVMQAPVDTGELEAAHKVVINRNQTNKAHYNITVGGVVNGVNVDEYAQIIHDGIGWWKLGPKSIEKQGRVPVLVGQDFLRRAIRDNEAKLINAVHMAAYKGAQKYVG